MPNAPAAPMAGAPRTVMSLIALMMPGVAAVGGGLLVVVGVGAAKPPSVTVIVRTRQVAHRDDLELAGQQLLVDEVHAAVGPVHGALRAGAGGQHRAARLWRRRHCRCCRCHGVGRLVAGGRVPRSPKASQSPSTTVLLVRLLRLLVACLPPASVVEGGWLVLVGWVGLVALVRSGGWVGCVFRLDQLVCAAVVCGG